MKWIGIGVFSDGNSEAKKVTKPRELGNDARDKIVQAAERSNQAATRVEKVLLRAALTSEMRAELAMALADLHAGLRWLEAVAPGTVPPEV